MIIALTLAVIAPMCAQKNLSALAPFSLLGLAGTLFTGAFMAMRFFDGSYAPGGKYFDSLPVRPVFTHDGYTLNHMTFVLLSMLSTSYIAHFNAPKFFQELQNPTMARFNTVVGGAFGAAIAFFIFIMVIGYATFGGNTLGFVLNNYSSADNVATIARFAIGLALVTSFPFTFSALREGIFDILGVSPAQREAKFLSVTFGLLGLITALALTLNDVGFVVSISGALFGCLLMFVVPAVMNIQLIKSTGRASENKLELVANYGLLGTGVVMAVLGVAVSVMRQMGHL